MKSIVLPLLAIVAIGFAIISMVRSHPRRARTEPPAPPPVAEYAANVAAVGLLEASTENVSIGSSLAGVVEEVFVQAGKPVKAREPLFKLDDRHLRAELRVRQASLATAKARVMTARANCDDAADQLQRAEKLRTDKVISADELMRKQFAAQSAEARLGESQAEVLAAEASIQSVETEIERSTVRSPLDADVLQVKVRAGEYAPAGQTIEPLLMLGKLRPLHLRVDVDEHEGWRIRPEAPAVAHVRGNADLKAPLKFVRFEPMVVPKRSLTGASTERVDTRVLQVIYQVADVRLPLFVGQQMDVFIENSKPE